MLFKRADCRSVFNSDQSNFEVVSHKNKILLQYSLMTCVFLLLSNFLFGCIGSVNTLGGVHYPNAVTQSMRLEFNSAMQIYSEGDLRGADLAFASFIETNPYTELTDKALFQRGEIAFADGNYDKAIYFYRMSHSRKISPSVISMAEFKEAFSLYKLDKKPQAMSVLRAISRRADAFTRLKADSLAFIISKDLSMGDINLVFWSLRILDDYSDGAAFQMPAHSSLPIIKQADSISKVRHFVDDDSISLDDINTLPLKEFSGKKSGGFVFFKLAKLYLKNGDLSKAKEILTNYITTYPKHEYYDEARSLLSETGYGFGRLNGVVIGAILPMSGKYAVYGTSVLNGMGCAAGIYSPCRAPSGLQILARDSSAGEIYLDNIVKELVDDGAVAIIGPLLSKNAKAVAIAAQKYGIPLISLSQKRDIVNIGSYIFRNSVDESSEIASLTNYVFARKSFRRFFILYPDNKKGIEYKKLFMNAILSRGGTIAGKFGYSPNQMEFGSELRGNVLAKNGRNNYDAIFIPDSFRVVGYIAPMIALTGVKDVHLLGISRWDNKELVERGGEYVEGSIFADSFFRNSKNYLVSSFISNFTSAYGSSPTLLEALGFDSMRMVIRAVEENGAHSRDAVRDSLASISGFSGVAGVMTAGINGNINRQFVVLTVKNGSIEPVQ